MSGALLTDETGDRKDGKKASHVGKQYRGGLGNDRQRVVSVSFLWADERLLLPARSRALPRRITSKGQSRPRFPHQAQDSARTGRGRGSEEDGVPSGGGGHPLRGAPGFQEGAGEKSGAVLALKPPRLLHPIERSGSVEEVALAFTWSEAEKPSV